MSDSTPNRLARTLAKIDRFPAALRTTARILALGRVVKFVGTAGLSIEELTPARAVVFIENRARVQNHIGGVHAAAMALVAETATGFVVGTILGAKSTLTVAVSPCKRSVAIWPHTQGTSKTKAAL